MGLIISDGSGKGYSAKVDSEGKLNVEAITQTLEHHVNIDHGEAYNVIFSQSPTANDDCIFYMVNSSDTMDLIVEGILLYVSAACEVYVKVRDKGTRNSATALTPINLNAGSGNAADGTFEKGADLDGGSATLTGGSEIERYIFTAAATTSKFNIEQDLILPKNETMTIWCDTLTATVKGTVVFHFHE